MKIKLVNRDEYGRLLNKDEHHEYGLYKGLDTEIKALGNSKVEFVISSGVVDRDRDVVIPEGGDFRHWKRNPVVLFAHNSHSPPVAKGSGIKVGKDGRIRALAEFTPNDLYPFGHMIGRMVTEGFLKATSIGFRPLKMKQAEDTEKRPWGIDFEEWELLEFSIVPIPANPEALIAAHTAGIDTAPLKAWCEEVLDLHEETSRGLSRDVVEQAWSALSNKAFFEVEIPDQEKEEEKKEAKTEGGASVNLDPALYVQKADLEPLILSLIEKRLSDLGIMIPESTIKFIVDEGDFKQDNTVKINATEEEIRSAIRESISTLGDK